MNCTIYVAKTKDLGLAKAKSWFSNDVAHISFKHQISVFCRVIIPLLQPCTGRVYQEVTQRRVPLVPG